MKLLSIFIFIILGILMLYYYSKKEKIRDEKIIEEQNKDNPNYPYLKDTPSYRMKYFRDQYENTMSIEVTGVHVKGRKQFILDKCSPGDEVRFFKDVSDSRFPDSIGVSCNKRQIGVVPKEICPVIGKIMEGDYFSNIDFIDFQGDWLEVTIQIKD